MKKNNMLRIASVLLVAVLLSTCAISGAFAKYTTSGTATDSARVAAFGINVDMGAVDAFGKAYAPVAGGNAVFTNFLPEDDAENGVANAAANAEATSVRAEAKVVAPGTKGSLGGYSITGTAEVDVEIVAKATVTLTNFTDSYCPIVIYVNDTPYYLGKGFDTENHINSIDKLQKAVADAAKFNGTLDAGKTVDPATVPVTWEWVFDENDSRLVADGALAGLVISDVQDTALGRLCADANDGNNPGISMTLTVTVNQVD